MENETATEEILLVALHSEPESRLTRPGRRFHKSSLFHRQYEYYVAVWFTLNRYTSLPAFLIAPPDYFADFWFIDKNLE